MTRRFIYGPVVVLVLMIGLCCTYFLSPVRAASPKAAKTAKSEPAAAAAMAKFGNAEAISQDDLRNFLYFLASDQLEGRNAPSRGFDTAALFVASHLAEWGLKPGGSASGSTTTNGPLQPYFMPMELLAKTVIPGESKASITAPASGRGRRGGGETAPDNRPHTVTFEYGKDWSIAGGRGAAPLDSLEISDANLVFAGNGYVIEKSHADPFAGLDVKGKIVVVAGMPPELTPPAGGRAGGGGQANDDSTNTTNPAAAAARGAALNALGEACKDYMTPAQAAAKNGAAAVITLVTFQELSGSGAGGGNARFGSELNGPAYRVPKLAPTTACKAVPSITAQLSMANALFQGEKFSAQQVFYAAGSGAKQEPFEMTAAKKITLKAATKSESNHVENVIGMLEGGDSLLKSEYVVMSAHLDHTGFSAPQPNGHNVNNGADDDGSGSAGLMAIAKAYAEGAAKGIRPKRSVIFLWAAGEEKGLWGSQYFNEYPPVDLSKVVADLNMDMIGRTKGPDFKDSDKTHVLVSPGEVLVIGPQVSSSDLDKTLETVNDSYQKLKINHFYDVTKPDDTHDNLGPQPRGQRIFYRSDHYNFAKMGIPIAFFTTGLHPDYHRPTDTPEKIDYKEMQIIAKTVAAVGWYLGTQEGRPKVNTTLPEQLQKDMKLVREQNWGQVTPVLAPLPHMPF